MAFDKDKPAASTSLRNSNPEILANWSAIETAADREHEFSTGGTVADQFHHKKGSARAFFQDAEPGARADGTAFTSEDLGSLWFDSNASPDNQFNVLTATTPTWTPVSTEIIAVAVAAIHTWAAVQTFSEIPVFTKGLAANNAFLQGRNNADSGYVDLLKANTSDQATFGVNVAAFTMAAAIAMGTNKITGLAAASAAGDAVRFEQVFNSLAGANASNGETTIGDLELKWGKKTVSASTDLTVTFASESGITAFSNACFKAFVSVDSAVGIFLSPKGHTPTQTTFKIDNADGNGMDVNWFAIGR